MCQNSRSSLPQILGWAANSKWRSVSRTKLFKITISRFSFQFSRFSHHAKYNKKCGSRRALFWRLLRRSAERDGVESVGVKARKQQKHRLKSDLPWFEQSSTQAFRGALSSEEEIQIPFVKRILPERWRLQPTFQTKLRVVFQEAQEQQN